MKIREILTEDFNDCIESRLKELFQENFEVIEISDGYEEMMDIMQNITSTKKEVSFEREMAVLNRLLELEDSGATIYVPKSTHQSFEDFQDVIDGSRANTMSTITEIQKIVRLLGKNAITEEDWEDTKEYASAMKQAEKECMEPSGGYDAAGMRPNDFA